ncbi:hypothetical protein [Sphingopyxis sp. GW247-27LB]|uniref:ORC-CDC6 family AAA ATPase n=1 Tax=Sphingopyxis sp. GW247-27LB TaxID=2012632 RepID=UPI000BA79AFB|nr:hypothetical protein [Sphingopyxis sp. GW247-27LB]PAL20461.1 hypothetical protein CD928_19015 [Sphingopyxis sp. GW247-27LB]
MSGVTPSNPFSLTKANDLSDDQIQELWVDIAPPDSPDSLFSAGRFASPMPTFILGSKGSGKTHLMRYASFALQKKRFEREKLRSLAGARADGYVGIYTLCSGLETGRFQGKGQSEEAWLEVFSYYLELSLGIAALAAIDDLLDGEARNHIEPRLCAAVGLLFDSDPPPANGVGALINELERRRRELDYQVNNAAFTGELVPNVTASRGKLIFGIPQAFQNCSSDLGGFIFAYQLDELENLTEAQQKHVNTLVRDRRGPATLKIGARQFGIKTYATMSAGEENIRDSEFEELRLDLRFRRNEKTYRDLVALLVERRLQNFWPHSSTGLAGRGRRLTDWFEEPKRDPFDPFFQKLVKGAPSSERPHIFRLRSALAARIPRGGVGSVRNDEDIAEITNAIAVPEAPLLEKLNTFLIFNAWARGLDLKQTAMSVKTDCAAFVTSKAAGRYRQKLDHYKSDLIAQMFRDASFRHNYGGLDEFTRMSEGQPRALITLLKQTFDWATFQGERPFEAGSISLDAESKGALAAADWFYNNMRKAGNEGQAILIAVDRLAELFRINRFADNPIECSLIGFSVSARIGSETSQRNLRLALDHSFLVEILGGQSERNSEQVTGKFQLNRMLVPKWGLATGRRGIKPLSEAELNAIFDPEMSEAFENVKADWVSRMNAPFDRARRASKDFANGDADDIQNDLFSD